MEKSLTWINLFKRTEKNQQKNMKRIILPVVEHCFRKWWFSTKNCRDKKREISDFISFSFAWMSIKVMCACHIWMGLGNNKQKQKKQLLLNIFSIMLLLFTDPFIVNTKKYLYPKLIRKCWSVRLLQILI